jgi:hypothetical protein
MAPTDEPAHRSHSYDADGDDIRVREADEVDDEDGVFEIRMPIASTGEVRNEGDDPLTRSELEGFATQITERQVPVFAGHGADTTVADGHYSPFERLGDWRDASFQARSEDGDDGVLMATARMPDPETLPAATGAYREGLAILKEQAKRGVGLDASIGWRTDDNFAGGNDLMEASIVGIGADWRTNTGDEAAEVVAREAVAAGADPSELVERVERAVRGPDPDEGRPLGPPGDRDRFEDFDECVATLSEDDDMSEEDAKTVCGAWENASQASARAEYEVGDETVTIDPPQYMADAADLAMSKSDEGLGSDCGTGVGDSRADQIRNDEVGPDVVVEIASYLTSHEEDVTADGPPSEWTDEEWDDCGNIQYAKWGGDGSGDALAWAQGRANAVADARDEELPYPERAARNLDDPAFSEGDAVAWDWQGDTVHGRVAGDPAESVTVGDVTIEGDDGEAVYPIHEYDEEVEAFRERNVAKPESSLSASQMDLPPATDENFQAMTDDDAADSDPPDGGTTDDAQDTNRAPDDLSEDRLATFAAAHYDGLDESDLIDAADAADAEFVGAADVEELYDLVSVVVGAEYDAVESAMEDLAGSEQEGDKPDDDEDDEEDDDGEMNADDPDDTQDAPGERALDAVEDLREEFRAFREGDGDTETPDRGAATDDEEEDEPTDNRDAAESPTDGLGDYR